MAEHSPLPWQLAPRHEGELYVVAADSFGSVVCQIRRYMADEQAESDANARFIVRAVNSHAELLAALKAVTDLLADQPDYVLGNGYQEEYAAVDAARAAIAKAEGR